MAQYNWYNLTITKVNGKELKPIRIFDTNGWEACQHITLPCLWYEVKHIKSISEDTPFISRIYTREYLNWYQ